MLSSVLHNITGPEDSVIENFAFNSWFTLLYSTPALCSEASVWLSVEELARAGSEVEPRRAAQSAGSAARGAE